jgi:hypothetical protein
MVLPSSAFQRRTRRSACPDATTRCCVALEQAALEQGVEEVHHRQYLKTTHEYIFLREPRQRVLQITLPDPLSLNKVVKMS